MTPADTIPPGSPPRTKFSILCLASLGIVFGDIGTSPLYALRECFAGPAKEGRLAPTPDNIMGVLSLIFWALMIVISLKYIVYVFRADNNGEGGILALLSLIDRRTKRRAWITLIGIFGAALLYGDGMITPAISVLSAVEGLRLITPVLKPFVVPITVAILAALFLVQRHGTHRVGLAFGPITFLWFLVIAALGVAEILRQPQVLLAVNPMHAARFIATSGWIGFTVLGAVFLVVTGGEALYADLGHFGRKPIRVVWFSLVLPSLLLNYFGQGALLLMRPHEITSPFFHLAPSWALIPLVILATCATIIASQAVISGAFSLTRQAVQLDEFPRVEIHQTSREEIGQIYIPIINWLLMIASICLVIGFRSSSNLAGAYGVAVTTTMIITTLLAAFVARERWGWRIALVVLVTAGFLVPDIAFFGANMFKIVDGGWFPLVIGAVFFAVMTTWKRGRFLVHRRLKQQELPIADFLESLALDPPVRVRGTSVFMTGRALGTPIVLLHHLKHNKALSQRVILLNVTTLQVPHVPAGELPGVERLPMGFIRVSVNFGFMDNPNVPGALRDLQLDDKPLDLHAVTYYVGRQTLLPSRRTPGMARWREQLFAFLTRNATQPVIYFHIPPSQVVELGQQIEI